MSLKNTNDNYPDVSCANDPRGPWDDYLPECPKCAATVETEWEFCPYCGVNIRVEYAAQAEAGYWGGE